MHPTHRRFHPLGIRKKEERGGSLLSAKHKTTWGGRFAPGAKAHFAEKLESAPFSHLRFPLVINF